MQFGVGIQGRIKCGTQEMTRKIVEITTLRFAEREEREEEERGRRKEKRREGKVRS